MKMNFALLHNKHAVVQEWSGYPNPYECVHFKASTSCYETHDVYDPFYHTKQYEFYLFHTL